MAKKYDTAKILFVNYQYEGNYNHILNKFVSLIAVMPSTLKAVILTLPEGATYLDSTLAEHLQRLLLLKHQTNCLVLFIRHEDKQMILDRIYAGRGLEHHLLPGL